MEPFVRLTAAAAPLDLANVDTERILPARFLRKPRSAGYAQFLFHDLRFDADGKERPDFVLNQPAYRGARILVAGDNFGCGSSREGAVWALFDYGIRAIVAPSFGDIFAENCSKNGCLAIVLPRDAAAAIRTILHGRPGSEMTVDLASQTIIGPDGAAHSFTIDPFRKECLLKGLDEIGITLEHAAAIAAFEARHQTEYSWLTARPGP